MPALLGWIIRGGTRLLKGWWIPILAAVAAWLAETFLGVISWSIVQVGSAVLEVTLDAFVDLDIWVDARPDWDGLCGTGSRLAGMGNVCQWIYSLLSLTGVLAAIAIVVTGMTVQFILRLVAPRRFG